MQKTIAAERKYDTAYHIFVERIKYGWQHAILQRPAPPVRFDPEVIKDRRVRALLGAAQAAGAAIAHRQLAEVNKRHRSHLRANAPASGAQ